MKKYDQLKALYDEIDVLIQQEVTDESPEFITWHTKAERFIRNTYGDGIEYKEFRGTAFGLVVYTFNESDSEWIEACRDGLIKTKAIFKVYLEELADGEVNSDASSLANNPDVVGNKVFVVHGHDGALKHEVARVLEKQGIDAIILSEQSNLGATIIEKFEKNSNVKAAICLFTPDDICKSVESEETKGRARQNVVFETGYFIGKLGRERVVLLANDSVEMPSDLSGIVYSNNSSWNLELLKELKDMGFDIDFNKAF